MKVFDQMLSRYTWQTRDEQLNALHEVMQQIALAGLYRGGFFDKAAFYGGTCLRMFYGIRRFSEDMDFSLLKPDDAFKPENYFDPVMDEFKAHGRDVVITRKEKNVRNNIESAFLKDNTDVYNLQFTTEKAVKIKIEIDVNPPAGFLTEHKLLLLPFSFMTRCYTLPDLYAGKMHAFLFRNWNNRVKGRDWYDFEWYVRNNVALNFAHLCERMAQAGAQENRMMDHDGFRLLLKERISQTNIKMVLADVKPFIAQQEETAIWSTDYFMQLVDLMRIE